MSASPATPVRAVAVADSDSYLKWGASLLDRLPADWSREVLVLRSAVAPDDSQVADALGPRPCDPNRPPPRRVTVAALGRQIRDEPPDLLVIACTGPIAQLLLTRPELTEGPRPVLLAGLPGLAVPASARAWTLRRGVDLFVVHSHRERREATAVNVATGGRHAAQVALARLPFLTPVTTGVVATAGGTGPGRRNRVVFAAQAKVPVEPEHRAAVLRALADLADVRPDLDVVMKLRADRGQAQTHREHAPYPQVWHGLVRAGAVRSDAVRFATGPMSEHLAHAAGLVTVSSTAALEALAADVGVLVLGDFGVNADMINEVFRGSGLVGSLADLRNASFARADPAWGAANYLHDPADDDLVERLQQLVSRRRSCGLPALARVTPSWRARVRIAAPSGAVRAVSRGRRLVPAGRRRG